MSVFSDRDTVTATASVVIKESMNPTDKSSNPLRTFTRSHTKDVESGEQRVYISGVPVTSCSFEYALKAIDASIHGERKGQYIAITNTESMYYAQRREEHFEFIERARFSFCDGVGVILAGKAQGVRVHRINGADLVVRCCEYGVHRGWRHFFYGGRPGVVDKLRRNLESRYPGMITAGTYCPPFRPLTEHEDEKIAELLECARPDIVWVGLGLPKQERWVAEHIHKLSVPWLVGVGAAFDFHAGTAKYGPEWIRNIGFQWLYRLLHEPRMLVRNWRSFVFLGESLVARDAKRRG
jgi:N-acetylglucosaminyldiphosphoundecaprenol N-acetyl-beta-D-mannosaminyltransferase